jgi:hypothetical protein
LEKIGDIMTNKKNKRRKLMEKYAKEIKSYKPLPEKFPDNVQKVELSGEDKKESSILKYK